MSWQGQPVYHVLREYGRGEGERIHRHTIGQVNVLLRGSVTWQIGTRRAAVTAPATWTAEVQERHGHVALEDETLVALIFGYWREGRVEPCDLDLVRREQAPDLTAEEAGARRAMLDLGDVDGALQIGARA